MEHVGSACRKELDSSDNGHDYSIDASLGAVTVGIHPQVSLEATPVASGVLLDLGSDAVPQMVTARKSTSPRHPPPTHEANMKRMLVVALTIVTTTKLVAQIPKPVIEQPTPLTGISSGTRGPKMPTMPRKTDPDSRAAHSDTTEILHAVTQKLRTKDVDRSAITIQSDTAWVSLTDPKYRGLVYRLERRHSWKVVDR